VLRRCRCSRRAAAFASVVGVTAVSHVGSAQGTDGKSNPAIGTWKLNLAKSKYNPGPPPQSQTTTIEAWGNGGIKTSVEGVRADGSRIAYSYTTNYDGKDYPYTGVGTPNGADTIALKRIDAFTVDSTEKKGAKVVATTRALYSKDGKLRTITSKGTNAAGQPTNNVLVFDRQ
jgi:hypothetical protein